MTVDSPGDRRVLLLEEDPPGRATLRLRDQLCRLQPELGFAVTAPDAAGAGPQAAGKYAKVLPTVLANGIPVVSGEIEECDLYRELVNAFGPDPWHGVPADEPEFLPLLECPLCAGELEGRPAGVCCLSCGHVYERVEGVLLLSANPRVKLAGGALERLGRMLWFKLE